MSAPKEQRPILVGLTGSIGAGKSTVASVFDAMGIPVLNADAIARELMNADPAVRKEIIDACGEEAYSHGELDRQFVASRIFADGSLRERVNAIVHPRTIAEQLRRAEDYFRAGRRVVVCEAALIFEARGEDRFDYIVVVDAPKDDRLTRAADRDGLSIGEVSERDQSQMPAEKKVSMADFVIRNDGTIEKLRANATFVGTLLLNLPPRIDIMEIDEEDADEE
jgi:dephospho-CoA kinase